MFLKTWFHPEQPTRLLSLRFSYTDYGLLRSPQDLPRSQFSLQPEIYQTRTPTQQIQPTNPMATKSIPEGYHSITPSFSVEGAQEFVDFIKQVFNAQDRFRMDGPGGKIMHAELSIGDSALMVADAQPQWPARVNSLYVYVDDVDDAYARALKAGATSVRAPENAFYGDRTSAVKDPFGNSWGIATHVEDVPPDELKKRAEAFQQQCAAGQS